MAERTVKVSLTAQVSGYIAGMEKAAAATRATGSEAEKLAQKKEAFTSVGHALLAIGAVAAVGVGLAIVKFAEFDAKMSQVKTLSHATAGEMAQLSDAALHMGQAIGFSATEVADAEIELVKAGVAVKDIMGGALKGALELAAAGQIDVAEATSVASSAMVQFGLKGKDVPHIADLLAAGADKALGGVSDLGQALKYAGPVAASFGVSLDETVGVLAEFAQNGILADQAGTGLRGVLSSLTSPSAIAADVMKKYGISLFDASGKFIGLAGAAGQLHDKLGGLTDQERSFALGQIFGNQQITTANILMKGGAQEVQKWTSAVNDQGFAAEQARGKMDNLAGDVKKLGAAFESDLIESGSAANGVLRGIVQSVTGLAGAFGDLPASGQGAVLVIGVVVAGLALLGGGLLSVVPKVAAFRASLLAMNTSLKTVGIAGGAVGLAITAIVAAFAILGASTAESKANIQALTDTLDANTGAMTKNTKTSIVKRLTDEGVYSAAKKAGISIREVNAAVFDGGSALDSYNKKSSEYYSQAGLGTNILRSFNGEAGALKDGVNNIRNDMVKSKDGWDTMSEGAADAGVSTDKASGAVDELAGATDKASQSMDDFNKALAGLGQVNLDASAAAIKYQQSVADMTASLKENGTTLDLTTEKGRNNQSALNDIASSTIDVVTSQQAAGASNDVLVAKMDEGRAAFIAAAIAAGKTAEQANALADEYHLVPGDVSTAFHTTGADAAVLAAQQVKAAFDAINRSIQIRVATILTNSANPNIGFGLGDGRASGGWVHGPGTSTSDSILTPTSDGEFVVNAAAAARNRGELEAINGGYSAAPQRWQDAGTRSYGVSSGSGAGATPQFNVVVQSKGGVDLLKYVDVKIENASDAHATGLSTGNQRGTFG